MLEILSDKDIMNEYPLKKIIRYNHRIRLQDESVAEHTCFVSLFCLKIMTKLNLTHEQQRQVLILAALHDTAESKTSDIPHDVKAKYPAIDDMLNQIEMDYYKESWNEYFDDVYRPQFMVYNILKLADAYSVYQWCLNEQSLGNKCDYLKDIFRDAKSRIEKYTQMINVLNEKLKGEANE